ncbi:MAG: alpha-amylase family glycosyl hydrolase [Verrucomicrobiota bacterium]
MDRYPRVPAWLNDAVIYQIFPPSFRDSNGDGIGDIPGIIEKLDYLQSMGFNTLWITPWFDSPFEDAGYDVADYRRVAPRYGKNSDARRLFREAHRRGIRVLLDLVAGHTSRLHPWFQQSCQPETNAHSEFYLWTQVWGAKLPGRMVTVAGYSQREAAYASNYFWFQPALNHGFAKPDPAYPWQKSTRATVVRRVRDEITAIMRFWLDMGADGFRCDMASTLVKNDPDKKETSRLWRYWRKMLDREYPEAVLLSEWTRPPAALAAGFHLDFMPGVGSTLFRNERGRHSGNHAGHSVFSAGGQGDIRQWLEPFLENLHACHKLGYIAPYSGNHDMMRLNVQRSVAELKVIMAFLLTLPGTPIIYYGDEIGMRHLTVPPKEGGMFRCGARTPMHWDASAKAGFSSAPAKKFYLPLDAAPDRPNVAGQMTDGGSLLQTVRQLIALRQASPALKASGDFASVFARPGKYPFAFLRQAGGETFLTAFNPTRKHQKASFDAASLTGRPELALGERAACTLRGKQAHLEMGSCSFGIFRLLPI